VNDPFLGGGHYFSGAAHRRSPRRRRSAARSNVVGSSTRVVGRRRQIGPASNFELSGVKQPLQKRPAPSTTRPRAKALRQLPNPPWLLNSDEVLNLPPGDVEAQAEFVVRIHL
jgi:hypothetical protein